MENRSISMMSSRFVGASLDSREHARFEDNLTWKEWEYVKEHGPCLDREYEVQVNDAQHWTRIDMF